MGFSVDFSNISGGFPDTLSCGIVMFCPFLASVLGRFSCLQRALRVCGGGPGGELQWSSGGVRCAAHGAAVAVDRTTSFCPFQVYVVAGGKFGRSAYQLTEKLGWDLCTTASGGFFSLLGISSSGEPELLVIEAPDLLFAGEVMASGHPDWPVRSMLKRHVGLPDVLFMVPLKFSTVLRRQGGRLHGQQLRSSAMR